MTVISNELRTITIEGVAFTPDAKGVKVQDGKIESLKDNFFFKHYVKAGAFKVIEEVKKEVKKDNTDAEASKAKNAAEKLRLQTELTELGIEFNGQLGVVKLQALLDEALSNETK